MKNMIKLSPRQALCAEFVRGGFVCDVGTDHGYLPAYLVLSGKCRSAVAADINEKPLNAAAATAEKYGVSDKISFVLSDGLKNICLSEITDIVIAGMGGELISKILSDSAEKISENINIILQPMTKAPHLRKFLCEKGFKIISEKAVRDGKFIYTVMLAEKTGNVTPCSDIKAEIGFMDFSLPDEKEYALRKIHLLRETGEKISRSDKMEAEKFFSLADKIYEIIKEF